MSGDRSQAAIRRLGRIFGWRRLVLAALLSSAAASILSPGWHPTPLPLYERALMLGLTGVLVFGVFEAWPRRLPRWLARWVLQVVGVALAMPVSLFTIYVVSTPPGAPIRGTI